MSLRPVKKSLAASYTVHQGGGRRMDAYDCSTGIYAAAVAMAKGMATEELSRTAILLPPAGMCL